MKRIEWIDIFKGIGIILVVVCHVYNRYQDAYLLKTIYLFGMPLYFFVSGYMHRQRDDIKLHIKNKFYQLFVPYFSLLILFLPISIFIFPNETNLFYYNSVPIDMLRYFFGRSSLNAVTGPLWFLPCLFFTQVVYNIMQKKLSDKPMDISVFILLILSYINYLYFQFSLVFPFSINLILASIPIYHIGHLYRKADAKDNIFLMLVLLGVAIWGIMNVEENVYNIAVAFYGVPFFTLLCSIVLTLWVKNISIAIDKYKIAPKLFINLGKASIVIMAFHLTFVVIFKKLELDPFFVTLFSTLIPLGIYFIFNRFTITRALFMGKREDARFIKNKIVSMIKR